MWRALFSIFHRKTEQVTSAALLLGAASLFSRFMGVIRDRLLASHFGAGSTLDAYYAAFRWPDTLYTLLIVGALTAGFIPVLAQCREEDGEEGAARLAGTVLSLTALVMSGVSIVLALAAPWIVPLTVSGFSSAQLQETVGLTRIMALSPLFLGLSAVMGGVLQTHKRFFAFAFAPIIYNGGIILGIIFLAPQYGIRGVAMGVVVGAILHALTQAIPVLRTRTLRYASPCLRLPRIRKILSLMGPRTAGLAIAQLNLLVLLAFASSLPEGSVSVLAFANNVQSVPLGLIGISFAVAALPALADAAAKRDREATTKLVMDLTQQVLFLVIPLAAWLILLRAQAVRMLLGHGAFDWDDTIRTALLVGWFAISLPAQALVPLFARVWYAQQNAWMPFVVGMIAELVNVSTALMLRPLYGVVGLGMAFSLAAFVQAFGLWISLRRRSIVVPSAYEWRESAKIAGALLASLLVGYAIRQIVGTIYPLRLAWQVWLQGGFAMVGCACVYAVISHLLGVREWHRFLHLVLARVRPRTSLPQDMDATESTSASL